MFEHWKINWRLYICTLSINTCTAVKLHLNHKMRPSWSWLYGSWIYNYLCNQCLSPLKLWFESRSCRGVLDTTLCGNIQWLAADRWISPATPVSSTNKDDIMLKVAINIITPTPLRIIRVCNELGVWRYTVINYPKERTKCFDAIMMLHMK